MSYIENGFSMFCLGIMEHKELGAKSYYKEHCINIYRKPALKIFNVLV